jgi:hypothetical protein
VRNNHGLIDMTIPLPPRPGRSAAPKAPAGLHAAAKAFWQQVVNEYLVDDPGSLLVLTSACEAMTSNERGATTRRQGGDDDN